MCGRVPTLGHLRRQLGGRGGVGGAVDRVGYVRDPRPVRRQLQPDETHRRVGAVGQHLVGEVSQVSVGRGPLRCGGDDPSVQVDRLPPPADPRAGNGERRAAVGERQRRPGRDVRPLLDVVRGLRIVRHLPVEAGELGLSRNRAGGVALSGRRHPDAEQPVAGEGGGIRPGRAVGGQHKRAGAHRCGRLGRGRKHEGAGDRRGPDETAHALTSSKTSLPLPAVEGLKPRVRESCREAYGPLESVRVQVDV